jgi:hypothetical protein
LLYIYIRVNLCCIRVHPRKEYLRVVIPANKETLAPKTLKTILKQAELTVEELKNFF